MCVLIGVAYFTLVERKGMAGIQRRRGPNVVGIYGRLQPLADGLKLVLKENVIPSAADKGVFRRAPLISFGLAMVGWVTMSLGSGRARSNLDLGRLFLFAVSSLGVYGVILAG